LPLGSRVDDLTFVQPDGQPIALTAFAGQPVLLIFLRHLV
jgi:hypothetical protein